MKIYKKYPCPYCHRKYPQDNDKYIYISRIKLAINWLFNKEMKITCNHCGGVAYTNTYMMMPFHFKATETEKTNKDIYKQP